ncbi:12390_t:CDS:1, partial [Racocetra fulgida]
MANANINFRDCSAFSIAKPLINVTWSPDPVGPDGTITAFDVNTLIEPASAFDKLIISFNDDFGRLVGTTAHPLAIGKTNIEGRFNAIIPSFIPPMYTIAVQVKDIATGRTKN